MTNILITGSTGFLGHHVMEFWTNHNNRYDRLFTPTSRELELMNPKYIRKYLRSFKINGIVHLAAMCGGIGANQNSPGDFIYNNLQMGINILESARECDIDKVLLLGTVCMYPKFTPSPFKESDIWNGYPEETNAPYGIAKKTIMEMGQAYVKQYDMNIINLIPTNLVGPFDHFETERSHVIPALIRKVGDAKRRNLPSINVWGDGSASREFLYAGDAAAAIYMAYQEYNSPEPINIGTGTEITIKDLVTMICELMRYSGDIIWDAAKPNGQPRRCLDVSKAATSFHFKATTPLRDAITMTIEYARNMGYV